MDVRLGGIYALQRIMEDSSRDQPTVVAVLCAFVRDHANTATGQSPHPPATPQKAPAPRQLATDIQAALTVVGTRNAANDGSTTVVDFIDANLTSATLSGLDLGRADLFGANLTDADLTDALLSSAYLAGANLTGALLFGALLTDADLSGADLTGALLGGADLSGANLTGTKGLRTGTRRSPIGSTPAPSATKNLRR